MAAVKISDFVQSKHSQCLSTGIESYVDIAKLLLELNTIAKTIAKGQVVSKFHTHERSLYEPLKLILENHLPKKGIVYVENLLYKNKAPKTKTDLSIVEISHAERERFDKCLGLTHFIEIKSLFYGDRISEGDIEQDLKKLVECEKNYEAKCFFVLTALETELVKHNKHLIQMQAGKRTDPFIFRASSGESIYLHPAGEQQTSNPHVFVFEVSGGKKTKATPRSGVSYSIFQGK